MQSALGNTVAVALLGRRDEPTDALRDYCDWLAQALAQRAVCLELEEVSWEREGWLRALMRLWLQSKQWRDRWVLMQYTSLSWSRRGFPFGALAVLRVLRHRGIRCAVVFHDSSSYPGERLTDRVRRACQYWVMSRAYRLANRCIFTIPPEGISWLPAGPAKAVFIPIGPNIPECQVRTGNGSQGEDSYKTVAVFGVTGGAGILREVPDIAYAVRRVREKVSFLRLVVLGRGSEEAKDALREAFQGTDVDVSVLGLLPAKEIACTLAGSDVLLFVRGHLSGRRGSGIAGIACGLPIVGYAGPETRFPITAAGVQLVSQGDREALAVALGRVLSDGGLRKHLRQRSLQAQANYFSWNKIAESYATVLEND